MRNQAMEQATSRLNSVFLVDAVEVLTAIMNDPTISPYARHVSENILEFAYKAYENEAV